MLEIRLAMLFYLLTLIWAAPASGVEASYPLIKVACDKQADRVTVTNSILKGKAGKNYTFSAQEGTYNPWDLIEVDEKAARARIIKKRKVVSECQLRSGLYSISIEPKTFSKYLDGRCGTSISASITVSVDGKRLLGKTAFEDYCHGNSPVIARVTVSGKTKKVKIKRVAKYKFY